MATYVDSPCKTFTAGGAIAQYLRVKLSAGKLAACDAADSGVGTIEEAAFADGDLKVVRLWNAAGTRKMVAAGAVSQYANVYGAAGGKVDDVANENFVGIALEAASGDGSVIEVYTHVQTDAVDNLGDIAGNVVIDDDFLGDWPAAATALSGQGPYAWTKTETNGLGVISSDEANGVLKFSFDAVAEAATAALYMANSPIDIDKGPIVEFILAVFDIGDDAALDINFGLASDTHATDFDSVGEYIAFHLDGAALDLKAQSEDGATTVAATDTTLNLVDNQYARFKIDCTDKANCKLYANVDRDGAYARVLSGTTFDMSNYSGTLTPIIHVEKTSNDTTADVRADRCRVQAARQ